MVNSRSKVHPVQTFPVGHSARYFITNYPVMCDKLERLDTGTARLSDMLHILYKRTFVIIHTSQYINKQAGTERKQDRFFFVITNALDLCQALYF